MRREHRLSIEEIDAIFDIDVESGTIKWAAGRKLAGQSAGNVLRQGHIIICVGWGPDAKRVLAHQLHGEFYRSTSN